MQTGEISLSQIRIRDRIKINTARTKVDKVKVLGEDPGEAGGQTSPVLIKSVCEWVLIVFPSSTDIFAGCQDRALVSSHKIN